MSDMEEEEEEFNEFHLPDDEPDWSNKLGSHRHVTSIRLFVDEMAEQDLRERCKELSRTLGNLTSLLICPYNESCPIIGVAGEFLLEKKLQELRLWFSEPVKGTQANYESLFQQLANASALQEFELHNPYEWEIEDGTLDETEVVPWILQSILGSLNKLPSLQDVAFSSFPLTQTNQTETALLQLCESQDRKPNLSLNIYDCELSSRFLEQVCDQKSRVTKLILTAIHNINESGLELAKTLKDTNQTLKSLTVRRMPGSKFTSSDLTTFTATTLVSSLKTCTSLESLEISVKTDDVGSPSFLDVLHQLEQVKILTIQWNGKTYDQVLKATLTLVDGITKNKSLTKLLIKARINKDDGQEAAPLPVDDEQQKTVDELKKKLQASLNQHNSLQEIDLEGVLATINVKS